MCVLCHMVWWKREFADVCGSCGCVSERSKIFSPSRVVGGGMLEGFSSKFLLL